MVRRKDPIWKHATELDKGKKFKCKFCGVVFSGGATRIKRHLSKETGGDIKSCNDVPEYVVRGAKEAIGNHKENNKSKKLKTDTRVKMLSNTNHADQDDQSLVDTNLASFMLFNNIPFDVVETPSFKEFVKSAVNLGTDYELPSVSMLRSRYWIYDTALIERLEEYTRDVEECRTEIGCTLIVNIVKMGGGTAMVVYLWTTKGLLFKAKFQYANMHNLIDGSFIDELSSVVESLEHMHIVQCICDDSYVFRCIQKAFSCYDWDYSAYCAFNIIVDIIVWRRDASLDVITCASMIFLYINNNKSINVTLGKEHERGKESDVSSSKIVMRELVMIMSSTELANWVISFSRLKSVLAAQAVVQASREFILSEVSEQSSEAKYARFVYLAIGCEEFWSRAKKLVEDLQPLFEAFCLVACHGGTIGYLYQAMERAKCRMEDYVFNGYEKWYSDEFNPMHKAAAILDPAYMLEQNLDNTWFSIFDDLVEESDKERFRVEFDSYCSKNSNIFTTSALDQLKMLHPGKWWELFGDYVPVLQKYALKIVMQPCISNFFTDDELRSIVIDETDGQYITKKMMMDKSSKLKAHLEKPANLDCQLTELYQFARREGTDLPGYKSFLGQISEIGEDFWDASRDPSFHMFDNLPRFLYVSESDEESD